MSVAELVSARVQRMQKGSPFPVERFYALGSVASVQKAMSRLTQQGVLVRVAKGMYARPKPLKNMPSIKMTAKAEDVAMAWAKLNGYKLVPQGLEAAYRLGLQTQAPVKTVYWSSGPSREFKIGNQSVIVIHTTDTKLRWASQPVGVFYRALLTLSAEHTSVEKLKKAISRLELSASETIPVLQRLQLVPQLRQWQHKLQQVQQELLS